VLEAESAPLRHEIESVRRRLLWSRALRNALLAVAALTLIAIAAMLSGCLGPPAWPVRVVLLGATAAALLVGCGSIAVPLVAPPSLAATAAHIERAFPQLDDRLLSAVQLAEAPRPDIHSIGLARALIADARQAAGPLALSGAVDLSSVRRAGYVLAGVVCVWAALVAVFPHSLAALWAAPTGAMEHPVTRGNAVTPRGSVVEAAPAPHITDVTVTLTPPSYSGLRPQTVTDLPRDIEALVGTCISVTGRLGAPTCLQIAGQDGTRASVAMGTDNGERGTAQFVLSGDVACRLVIEGERSAAVSFRVRAIADARPVVRIEEPGKDVSLEQPRPIRIVILAVDDFGLSRVALQYRVNDERQWHTQDLAHPGTTTARLQRSLDLSPMALAPGDVVAYRAVASDNDAISGPKSGASRTYVVRLKHQAMAAAGARLEQAERAEMQSLEELRDEVDRLGIELDQLTRELDKPGVTFERQSAGLQDAVQRIEALTEKLDAAIADTMHQMALSELVTPEVMEKVGQLQKLLQETLDEGLRESLERVQEAIGSVDPEAIRQQLLHARDLQQQFLQRLDQTIELLKGVQREQRLGEAVAMAEQLVRRQAELRERTEEIASRSGEEFGTGEPRELDRQAEQQGAIARDTADLQQRLAELADEIDQAARQAALRTQASAEMRRLSDTREARRAMQAAAQQLREQRPGQALPRQTQALSALRQLVAGLKQRQAAALADARGTLPGRLQQMARDALYLSQQQEQLMERTQPLSRDGQQELLRRKRELESLAREQEAVARGAGELARGLGDLSRQTQAVRPSLAQRAETGGERAMQAARDIRGAAASRALAGQREAMRALNETAAELIQLALRAAGASQRMALEQYLKQLEAMTQSQQALNEQTAQQLGETGPPLIPGTGALQQLAAEQELIRGAMEKMLQQSAQDGESRFGDQLGNVPGQMEDVENDLRQARADRKTLQTQGDILRKMLDAQRSLHTKEQRPERKAEQAKPYVTPKSPPKLRTPERADAEPQEAMMPPETLPLDFEVLVRDYFRWLGQQRGSRHLESR
jgi:hypothetical protein